MMEMMMILAMFMMLVGVMAAEAVMIVVMTLVISLLSITMMQFSFLLQIVGMVSNDHKVGIQY